LKQRYLNVSTFKQKHSDTKLYKDKMHQRVNGCHHK